MPWLPAPISHSTCRATSLRSISPSWRNGVVIGGITPVGRIFMIDPSLFPFPADPIPLFGGQFRSAGASLSADDAAIQLRHRGAGLSGAHSAHICSREAPPGGDHEQEAKACERNDREK